ncbi:hypothetical protein J2R99_003050 [Rhodopseudomonas julia]|uniref:Uncharacterized protein n=1 Tax=Rhodopseudomonas julia TaxID=200617 RepID=A0ABU0C9J0_9BRAD|nr:hypothetical protein [Rhodopseudomonas julia]MDQ0327181.1 hypothetical protein [Rhodopseudomonas julia]
MMPSSTGPRLRLALFFGLAIGTVATSGVAFGRPLDGQNAMLAADHSSDRIANVRLHFMPEDDPRDGHVKVLLTPESRPLTFFEARQAVQQAFLATLKEPGLPSDLTRVSVTVQLAPSGAERVQSRTYLYIRKTAETWTVMASP